MQESTTQAFILSAETANRESGKILLYGACARGPVAAACDFQPYFYVSADAELPPGVRQRNIAQESSCAAALSGERLHKIFFGSPADAESCRSALLQAGVRLFESDVRPRERFLMDRGLNGGIALAGASQLRGRTLWFENPTITPAAVTPVLRICSLDIETSVSSGTVLSAAVHLSGAGRDERKVFMLGETASEDGWLSYAVSEKDLLEQLLKWFTEADPDIIIGWNVVGFDLAFLLRRSSALGFPLKLGRDGRVPAVSENSGRFARARICGRVVLDGPSLLRTSFFSFESYSLEHVSRRVLGEGKLIGPETNRAWEIERLFKKDKRALADYNLNDALLVTRIFEKLGLLELTIRRTQLSGMLLDQVGLSTAAFDHFYLPRLHRAGYAAPDLGDIGEVEGAAGGYVMSPQAGLYGDIISLDFQSLYPSIIRTFNIDPLARAYPGSDAIVTPKGFSFAREKAILPAFIAELMQERQSAKQSANKPLSQAIKILMNSFYGVMGSGGCRFYHPALPDAITSTGQWLLMESKHHLESLGHRVIYGDTDSLFVELAAQQRDASVEDQGAALASTLNRWWAERLQREFKVESQLLLEFKKVYTKFFVPAARGAEGGAKKRYAGMVRKGDSEKIEFVGLEAVRSDWTRLAQEFQLELYTRIFRGETADAWLREYVMRVRRGEFDDKLVYRKRLHKPLEQYGKSPPPYVRAAQLLSKPSRDISYVMTLDGPVPAERNPRNFDYEHYIQHQLRPIADSVLEVFGTSFSRILSPQLSLF